MTSEPHSAKQTRLPLRRGVALLCGLTGLSLGSFFLAHWLLIPAGQTAWVGYRMKANATICLILVAVAQLLLIRGPGQRSGAVIPWLGLGAAAIAGATLVQYLTGVELGIDQLLARDHPHPETAGHPNRMAPNTALCFLLLGLAVTLLASRKPTSVRIGQALALVTLSIGLLAAVGYLYEAPILFRPTQYIRMSPFSALAVTAVALGALACRTDLGVARLFASHGPGGFLARRLILPGTVAGTLFGWLRLEGERQGWYTTATGTSLLVVLTITTFAVVVVSLGQSLDRINNRRQKAEREERRSAELTAALAGAASVGEVVDVTIRLGLPALGCTSGSVMLLSPDQKTLRVTSAQGYPREMVDEFRSMSTDADLPATQALRTRQPVFIADENAFKQGYPHLAVDFTTRHRSWAALPVQGRERMLGVLGLSFSEPQSFSAAQRDRLVQLARQCGQALDRALLFDEREEARAREQSARESAEAANRAKDEFMAILGHELRNPLSPILTALQLMKLRADEGHKKERAIIERQVQHMVLLVEDLLDVSRITRGKIALNRRRLVLAELVGKAVEVVSPLFEQRQHRLSVEVPPGLAVMGDPHRLTQVLTNLLTNAAKYTPPGGQVDLLVEAVDDRAVIRIRDTGVGIPADLLPRIFDLFVQGYRSPERSDGGLGLGLSIVRMLVEMHGGQVTAESEGPGQGSTFTVRLPLELGATVPLPAPGPAAPAEPVRERRRVMVVDDNRDAAELLAEALNMEGHEARVAYDGPAALALASEFRPDLAFLDIGLPVMDGYELARRLRANGDPALTLIALTGYGQPGDRARSAAAGFDQHLVKPIGIDDALAIVAGPGRQASPIAERAG